MGAYVHTLLAKHVRGVHALDTREKLVYRGPGRRKRTGRPINNTPALQIE
jgi:hypothetical protein